MYFLLVLAESLLAAGLIFLMAVFTPPAFALIVSVALLLAIYIIRPAQYLDQTRRREQRRVVRRYRPAGVPDGITMRPGDGLSPAEVFRLMEIIGVVPKDRLDVADFTATLLDLNRKGVLTVSLVAGEDPVHGDGMRIVPRRDLDKKRLLPHEQMLIKMLKQASGPATSIQLAAFYDAFTRFPVFSQRKTDAFRRAVDRNLKKRGLLKRTFVGKRSVTAPLGRRTWLLTRNGEQSAAMWRTYCKNICTRPFLDSYRASTAEQMRFAKDAFRLLVDAAACGYAAKAAECLEREYLFDPMEIWHDGQYFSTMTESRTAFSGTEGGEAYFFSLLRDFEEAIRIAVTRGTPEPSAGTFR